MSLNSVKLISHHADSFLVKSYKELNVQMEDHTTRSQQQPQAQSMYKILDASIFAERTCKQKLILTWSSEPESFKSLYRGV